MGHRAFFFKCSSNKDLKRWIADLSWRVEEGERKIAAKFEPGVKGGTQPAGGLMELPAAHQGTLILTLTLPYP